MATLSELQARREALMEAIQSGELRVRYGDRDVTYRSLSDMRTALSLIDDEIARLSGTKVNRKVRLQRVSGW